MTSISDRQLGMPKPIPVESPPKPATVTDEAVEAATESLSGPLYGRAKIYTGKMRTVARAVLTAAAPHMGAVGGVKIKPLEWEFMSRSGGYRAHSPIGTCFAYPDGWWSTPHASGNADANLEAAKAAAQADYEQRIRSALEADAPAHPVSVPDGWRLVPVEATWEMQVAGRDEILSEDPDLDLSTDDARVCYAAMLAASPEAPAQGWRPISTAPEDPEQWVWVHAPEKQCQTASNIDPRSASNIDPGWVGRPRSP